MRPRAMISAMAVAVASVAATGWAASPATAAPAATVCTWGGTPAAPTGTFSITPGITNIPSPEPLRLKATGELAGGAGCTGTMTFIGEANAGSSCAATSFEGTVAGLPGVVRFWGPGVFTQVNEQLYDKDGNVVGADQPSVLTTDNAPRFTDCNTPQGFTGGTFSSTVQLYR